MLEITHFLRVGLGFLQGSDYGTVGRTPGVPLDLTTCGAEGEDRPAVATLPGLWIYMSDDTAEGVLLFHGLNRVWRVGLSRGSGLRLAVQKVLAPLNCS